MFLGAKIKAQDQSETRIQFAINDNWKFNANGSEFASNVKTNEQNWTKVDLPHTWNAKDPFDDDASYKRGICWYRKHIKLSEKLNNKRIYIYFEGANQVTDVYINSSYVGQHKGGYTAFNFDITDYVKFNGADNVIAVQVNNATDFLIPPLSVGYAMYGGIYRDTWIIATNTLHFSMKDYGSKGIYITTPKVSNRAAALTARGQIQNQSLRTENFKVTHTLYDSSGKAVAEKTVEISAQANSITDFHTSLPEVKNPKLWSPDQPYLYTLVSQIKIGEDLVDELSNKVGFRWYEFNAKNGFALNGNKYTLKGTNRHQDLQGKGSALTNQDHYRDLKMIKEMGCNFLRLAHYPQDPEVLRLADRMGLLIWEEIPVVNNMNPDPAFAANAQIMAREMIRQHYNHPSIVLWGSMNEVLLWSKGNERIQKHEDTTYLKEVRKFELTMDSTVRAEDPNRYSTMAMHMSSDYEKFKMTEIPQVVGWNIYNGWYSGKVEEFGPIFDKRHIENPAEILFISEYGAESDRQINTEKPQRLDFSGNYQRFYHESYLAQIKKRPYLAGTAIWNQFDFSQPNIGGTISHINHKGMATWDRIKKDVFYLYKANWNPLPMVYIATRDWLHRGGKSNAMSTIDVYANLENVWLTVNGKKYPAKQPNEVNKFVWQVQLKPGENTLIATGSKNGKSYTDQVTIYYEIFDDQINNDTFSSLAVNIGSNAQYVDDSDQLWIEDRPYHTGSYGYINAEPSALNIKSLITNTDDTPLFYTFLDKIKSYRLDLMAGIYEVELCFAEPENIPSGERIFSVSANGSEIIENLDLSKEGGFAVAIKKKFIIETKGPLQLDFKALKGTPILNGLKINKL